MTDSHVTLIPNGYRPRLIETRLDALMRAFGCIEIVGPKWCGKTWTGLSRARSVARLDSPTDRDAAELDPSLALVGDTPHLVDEWQEVPSIWDAARRYVDNHPAMKGGLILTGSTALSPNRRGEVHHTGAGRIAHIRMRPMSLAEQCKSTQSVSLSDLFDGTEPQPSRTETTLEDIATWCCRGGWPATMGLDDDAAFETPVQYIQSVIDVNVLEDGRSPETALALLRALAVNASRSVTHATLAKDMAGRWGASANTATIVSYLDLLGRLYLTESIPGWEPPLRAKARVRVKPKRYFADPSLASALLGATPNSLLHDTQTLGDLFENLVLRDLSVYLSTMPGLGNDIRYYRDEKGLEVDFILQHGAQWAAVEVKLSDTKVEDGAASLLSLKRKLCENPRAQTPEPAFMAVIVGRGSLAYRRPDGVYVIPIAALTA